MRTDPTVARAAKHGTRTQPVAHCRAKPASIKRSPITPDELADIITQARADRAEADIRDYAARKAS